MRRTGAICLIHLGQEIIGPQSLRAGRDHQGIAPQQGIYRHRQQRSLHRLQSGLRAASAAATHDGSERPAACNKPMSGRILPTMVQRISRGMGHGRSEIECVLRPGAGAVEDTRFARLQERPRCKRVPLQPGAGETPEESATDQDPSSSWPSRTSPRSSSSLSTSVSERTPG